MFPTPRVKCPECSTGSSNLPDESHHREVEGSSDISPVVPDKTHHGEVESSSAQISPDHQNGTAVLNRNPVASVSGGDGGMSEYYSNAEKRNRVHTYLKNSKIIVVAFASAAALLSVSYTLNGNGSVRPEYLFRRHHVSFLLFLLSNMLAFFMAAMSMEFQQALPMVARAFNMIAFTALILSFTVIMWALLPDNFSCLPWFFFSLTLVVMLGRPLYVCFTKYNSVGYIVNYKPFTT